MKKTILLLACMLVVSIAASAYNTSAVVLHHNGKMTTYEANQINDALDAAVDGDLIMLSEGTYPAFKITKKITIRGVGEMTIIDGDIDISIPDEPTLTANLLEFMKVVDRVYVKLPIRRMVIKQCNLDYNSNSGIIIQAKTTDSYIDRCKIYYVGISETYKEKVTVDGVTTTIITPYAQGLTFSNCVIKDARGVSNYGKTSTGSTFLNCYIKEANYSLGSLINSIAIQNNWELQCTDIVNTYLKSSSGYTSTMLNYDEATCTLTNCYLGEDILDYTTADLASLGYYGNDGTIIGPLGGNTPYTLTPAVPHVTESSMKVDTEKKQLSVTLTVSPK